MMRAMLSMTLFLDYFAEFSALHQVRKCTTQNGVILDLLFTKYMHSCALLTSSNQYNVSFLQRILLKV